MGMLHAPDRVTKGVELGMRGGRVRGGVEGRSERFREALAVRVVDTRCEPRAGIIAQPRGFPDVVDELAGVKTILGRSDSAANTSDSVRVDAMGSTASQTMTGVNLGECVRSESCGASSTNLHPTATDQRHARVMVEARDKQRSRSR